MLKKVLLIIVVVGLAETLAFTALPKEVLRVFAPPWVFKKFPLEEVAARFEAEHPDVTVELTRASEWSPPTYITAWKSGTTPFDVFVGGTGSMLGSVIAGDWLVPLDDMLCDFMSPDNFVGGFLADAHYKKPDGTGAYYPVLPFMGEVAVIGVNTNFMKEAGLWENGKPVPIPSWDEAEFFAWFNRLKAASPLGAHIQIWNREFMQYNYCGPLKAMTGTFIAPDGKGFDFSSPAAHKWLTYIQKMYKDGIGVWTITDDAAYSKWKTGQFGSFYAAQGHIMELVSVTGKESDIAYIGWPGATENGSIIWTHYVWIPKVSSHVSLAKQFIREAIFSQYFQQWSFNHYGKLPALKTYYGEGITWFQDQLPTILAIAERSEPIPLFKDIELYLDILSKYLPEVAFCRIGVDEAIQKIQEEAQNLDFTDLRVH